jgi:hypothetical protein
MLLAMLWRRCSEQISGVRMPHAIEGRAAQADLCLLRCE